jgi:hypothetical protein
MLLHGLLAAFPENALTLYNTLDYWGCRDLLHINSNAKIDPGEQIQEDKNAIFNELLDGLASRRLTWRYVDGTKTLRQIQKQAAS